MSDHRKTAALAATADARPLMTSRKQWVHGSSAVTPAEREALAEGVKTGARYRQRLAALDMIDTADALTASGVEVDDSEELSEARELLTEWQQLSAPGRGNGIGRADRSRMTARDVANLSAYTAHCAGRMARPVLSEAECEDIRADAIVAILRRGLPVGAELDCDDGCSRCGGPSYYRATLRPTVPGVMTGRAHATVLLCLAHAGWLSSAQSNRRVIQRASTLPRWDSLTPADAEDAPTADTARLTGPRHKQRLTAVYVTEARDRWRGFAYLEARAAIRRRHDRLSIELPAATLTPADALSAEAGLYVTAQLQNVDPSTVDALTITAPGERALSAAERDALWIGLSGLTREDLAAARGVSANAIKVGAQRGRKALAARVCDLEAAREWSREANREDIDRADCLPCRASGYVWGDEEPMECPACRGTGERDLRSIVRYLTDARRTREQRDISAPAGERKMSPWPIREAPCDGGDTGHVPPPITGAGTWATAVLYGCAERTPSPRRTVSGAPVLPRHLAVLRMPARAARTLRSVNVPPAMIGPLPAATVPALHRPATGQDTGYRAPLMSDPTLTARAAQWGTTQDEDLNERAALRAARENAR